MDYKRKSRSISIKYHPGYQSLSPLEKRILLFVHNHPRDMDDYQIAEHLKVPLDKVRDTLKTLVNLKLIG